MSMIEIKNLTKTYKGGKKAVDNLSLSIESGDLYAFIGQNGAGKTTTLKAIAGILNFEQGEIFVDGKSIKTQSIEAKKVMAFIPDNPDIYNHLTGIQYLNFVADIYGVSKEMRESNIKKYADAFELTSSLGDGISSYSHGMRQKLVLISALIHQPKLLLLDEPFVGLDPKAALILKDIMRELCDAGGAIFYSTHVLDVAEKLCDKVAIIKAGKLVANGPMDIIKGDTSLEEVFMEVADHDQVSGTI